MEALLRRHAGVLGLGALVLAFPYEVPEFMPKLLMTLSNHVNDPQPVQVLVLFPNFFSTNCINVCSERLINVLVCLCEQVVE